MTTVPPHPNTDPPPQVMSTIASIAAPADPDASPTEVRRSRRKRTQKDADIEELSPDNITPTPVNITLPTEGEKKRKTGSQPTTSTPLPAQSSYSFNFTSPAPPQHTPLIEESFFPQMASPSPTNTNAPPSLQLGAFDLDHDMSVSEANTSQSLDTPAQSRTTSSLKSRLIVARERGHKINANSPVSKDPMDKYTKGKMPGVHYNHPTAALDFIDFDQIDDWETLPDGKLLAHPFGHEVRTIDSHQGIKASIFAAVIDITQSDTVGVCSPRPCPSLKGTPSIFLIYNISDLHRKMLLKREVWSSSTFTFRVTNLDPVRPDYLFGLTNLTIKDRKQVHKLVEKVWAHQDTATFIDSVTDTYPDDEKATIKKDFDEFTKSMWVKTLKIKKRGGDETPTFNVYATAKFINDDGLWCLTRNFFASQIYAPQFQDPGIAGTDLHRCSICHGVDHPRGLCPFLLVVGWNGPFAEVPEAKNGDDNRKPWSAKPWKGKGRAF